MNIIDVSREADIKNLFTREKRFIKAAINPILEILASFFSYGMPPVFRTHYYIGSGHFCPVQPVQRIVSNPLYTPAAQRRKAEERA